MSESTFDLTIDGKVAEITLNRPDALNSFTPGFWSAFREQVEALDDRGDVRALVISSTGKHFTAGMDLSVFHAMPDLSAHEPGRARAAMMKTIAAFQETFNCLERARFPVLAAIQGGCIGGGVDLIAACDVRYCTADAFFVIQETNIGMMADVGTFPRLQKVMHEGLVRELAFTGRRLAAERALSSGLVNDTYQSQDEMLQAVRATAQEIAEKSPLAVWGSKEALNYGRDHSTTDTLKHIVTWQAGMWHMPDMQTAFKAQKVGEKPEFDDLLPNKPVI
ncbi:MAG: enoyl-CoA hydratase-related protein [Pseudomonadota bacterium]